MFNTIITKRLYHAFIASYKLGTFCKILPPLFFAPRVCKPSLLTTFSRWFKWMKTVNNFSVGCQLDPILVRESSTNHTVGKPSKWKHKNTVLNRHNGISLLHISNTRHIGRILNAVSCSIDRAYLYNLFVIVSN